MFLFLFLGISWLLCFVWCLVLIRKILNLDCAEDSFQSSDISKKSWSSPVLNEAQLNKLMPVGTSRSWTLSEPINGHRIWHLKGQGSIQLFGLSLKIKSSAQNLVKFIGRPTLFKEWRCGIMLSSAPSDTSANHRQVLKWKQKKLECKLIAEYSAISWWLEPLLESDCTVTRSFLSGAKYSGIVENNEYSETSTVFICQPIIGLENDQCRLTAITSGDINRLAVDCQCLSDHFVMIRATVDSCPLLTNDSQLPTQADTNRQSDGGRRADVGISASTMPTGQLVSDEEIISAGSGDHRCTQSDDSASNIGEQSVYSDEAASAGVDGYSSACGDGVEPALKFPADTDERKMSRSGSHADSTSLTNSAEFSERREHVEGFKSVVFLRTISSDNQSGLVDYKTLSNTCAADLLREVITATTSARRVSQDKLDGSVAGWVFDSTDREVAVLCRLPTSGTTRSWIGKGMIKQTPEIVWQTVVNPYSRYIFDEMLKDLTILSDLGNGMKLLKLCYCTSQVLRRDTREFYLLQAERIEKKKRIVTICSFDWPEAETKHCPRGKFGTSGWIIEPLISRNNHTYSMVTYLSQIDLGEPSSGTLQFEEDFVTKQPLAIAHLRDYLTVK